MNIVEKLDLAIKSKETGTTEGYYYIIERFGISCYPTYLTNKEWSMFLSDMPEAARKEYEKGNGTELYETIKRVSCGSSSRIIFGGPPKMASFGSSSRMIYNLSKEKKDFHFEKKLPTTVGGTANLDGFYEDDDRYIFVEAKCHEPYSTKKVTVSKAYAKLYNYINEQMLGSIQIDMQTSKCGRYLNVEYYADGEKLEHFDLKQMICHLLGIATGMLNGTLKRKQTDFIYLLYDPTELDIESDVKEKIDAIYERTCYECNLVDFAELYRVILEFLRQEKYTDAASDADIYDMVIKFTFALASQEFYPILLA